MVVANPIYDVVFKYLMEDERIARTILSALLKKDVTGVEVRPHEYSNDERENLSVFRIDFGATVREADGTERLILVELQKTWIETETLRFRQYLGVQYRNPKNMAGDYSLPMVAVYLLGHKVGEIEEPVLYVSHQARDYNENIVTKGLPDPFVESLTHDSIIVQIPRLHGQINNRLDMVLSVFDQTYKDHDDEQVLRLDEAIYSDDNDMQRILHRLTQAAADANMRHRMDVEDEYFSVIERRDTEILMKDKQLAEKNVLLAEKNVELAKKEGQLKEKEGQLKEKDGQLKEKDGQLKEKEGQLKEKDGQLKEKDGQLKEKEGQLKEKEGQLKEKDGQLKEKDGQLKEKEGQLKEQQEMLRTSIQLFLQSGLPIEDIAQKLGKEVDELENLLGQR